MTVSRIRFDPTRPPLEDLEQVTVMQWAAHVWIAPPVDCRLAELLVFVPNAARRSYALARQLKKMGLATGFPDLLLPVRSGAHGLLAIELKRRTLSRVEESQEKWKATLTLLGQRSVICYGADEAINEIRRYMRASELTIHEFAQMDNRRP